jgi:NADH-quinone oxidoreductase subunit A
MDASGAEIGLLWPLVVYVFVVLLVVGVLVGGSYLLGQRHQARATNEPFESGIVSIGFARFRLSAKFYLVAMLFVIFDMEAIFLFAWAVAFREVGWNGYIGALIFIAILSVALVYEWRMSVLDWAPIRRQRR